jgi:import inner membrane translocase subunit TIM50
MLAGALRASLRAPAVRATPKAFRTAPIQQWSRGYAKVGKPSTPEFKKDEPVSAAPSFSSPKQKVDEKATPAADKADPEFSTEQSEFKTNAEPAENKTKQVEEDVEDKLPEGFKLPDLRGGLPSTLEFETTGQSATQSAKSALNLTEDPEKEGPTPGSGKGPKKELPDSAYVSSNEKKRLRVANYMYAATLVAVVGGAIYLGRDWDSEEERLKHTDVPTGWSPTAMWARFRARTGDQLEYYAEPAFKKLLPDPDPSFERPYTLVLSLEDLLIHSEWSREHGWRMAKRPGVDYFLRYLSQYYELVVFTSVPWAVAEPIIKKLDPYHIITWPLFREATVYKNGKYVKVRNNCNS